MEPKVQPPPQPSESITVAAQHVSAGDRIAKGFLPGVAEDAEVVYTRPYSAHGHRWAFAVVLVDGAPEPQYWLADAEIPVIPGADPDHGRTTAVAEAKPDTLVVPLGHAAEDRS